MNMQKEIPLVLAGFLFFVRFYSKKYQIYVIDSALKNKYNEYETKVYMRNICKGGMLSWKM